MITCSNPLGDDGMADYGCWRFISFMITAFYFNGKLHNIFILWKSKRKLEKQFIYNTKITADKTQQHSQQAALTITTERRPEGGGKHSAGDRRRECNNYWKFEYGLIIHSLPRSVHQRRKVNESSQSLLSSQSPCCYAPSPLQCLFGEMFECKLCV